MEQLIKHFKYFFFLALLINVAAVAADKPTVTQAKEKSVMSNESFPNYDYSPQSPSIDDDMGVSINLHSRTFTTSSPIIVRGSFKVDQKFINDSGGIPLGRIILIVAKRDDVGVWYGPVQDISNIAMTATEPDAEIDPHYRETGYFNLQLSASCDLIKKPGKYWLMATMGDWVSERIKFQVDL